MSTLVFMLIRLINLYATIIVVYCLMSWLPRGRGGIVEDIRAVLGSICEPYLGLFRRFIPPFASIDVSPIVAILVLALLTRVIAILL